MKKKRKQRLKNRVVVGPQAFAVAIYGNIHIIMHFHIPHKLWFRAKMSYRRAYIFDFICEKVGINRFNGSIVQRERKISLEITITYHGYLKPKNVISVTLDIFSFRHVTNIEHGSDLIGLIFSKVLRFLMILLNTNKISNNYCYYKWLLLKITNTHEIETIDKIKSYHTKISQKISNWLL